MVQKTVSLSEKAYNLLSAVKEDGESYSQLIMRLIKRKKNTDILKFAGAFKDNSDEWEEIENWIYSRRKESFRIDKLLEDA